MDGTMKRCRAADQIPRKISYSIFRAFLGWCVSFRCFVVFLRPGCVVVLTLRLAAWGVRKIGTEGMGSDWLKLRLPPPHKRVPELIFNRQRLGGLSLD